MVTTAFLAQIGEAHGLRIRSGDVKVNPCQPGQPPGVGGRLGNNSMWLEVCLSLSHPSLNDLNGSLNGFVWPGYTLHLEEMG